MITFVPSKYVDLIYDEIRPLYEKAAKRSLGYSTADDYEYFVYNETHQLWVILSKDEDIVAIILTTIEETDNKRVLYIFALASIGDGDGAIHEFKEEVLDELDNFAVINKCDSIRIEGRRGWKKIFSSSGYKEVAVVLEKDI